MYLVKVAPCRNGFTDRVIEKFIRWRAVFGLILDTNIKNTVTGLETYRAVVHFHEVFAAIASFIILEGMLEGMRKSHGIYEVMARLASSQTNAS
jgi:hypothetical protein